MGSGGRHEKSRKGKHPGMSATAFALSTLVLLGAVAVAAAVVMPASPWLRLLSAAEPGAHAAGLPSRPGLVTALAMLLVSLYVFARATRNATLEVDRIRTRPLRYAWMFLFEGIWAVGFACIGEGLATHAALLSESLSLPSFTSVSGAGTCVVAAAMWVAMALAAVARCAMARHEHTGRHVARETLRAVGRSTLVTVDLVFVICCICGVFACWWRNVPQMQVVTEIGVACLLTVP